IAGRDIADDHAHQPFALFTPARKRDLCRKFTTFTRDTPYLQRARVRDSRFVRGNPDQFITVVSLAASRDQLADILAAHLLCAVAEQRGGGRVPEGYATPKVSADNGVRR